MGSEEQHRRVYSQELVVCQHFVEEVCCSFAVDIVVDWDEVLGCIAADGSSAEAGIDLAEAAIDPEVAVGTD